MRYITTKKISFLGLVLLAVPLVVSARHGQDLEDVFFTILNLVNLLALIVIALAVLYFFWGVARYILSAGSDKEEGKSIMVWGIIAIFVMVSIWGLIRLLQNTFSVTDNNAIIPAEVQRGGGGGSFFGFSF